MQSTREQRLAAHLHCLNLGGQANNRVPYKIFHPWECIPKMEANATNILDLSVKNDQVVREAAHTETEESPSSSTASSNEFPYISSTSSNSSLKIPRPFKAYPKDPMAVAVNVATAEALLGQDSAEAYMEFRRKMLSKVQVSYTNKNMRRQTQRLSSNFEDPSYLEKRRKNNEAAKRSRDARRAKEDEIAIRCAFLEQENLKLRYEIATLRSELERLRLGSYH